MAGTVTVTYSWEFLKELWLAEHDIDTHTLKVALMVPAFSFNAETHDSWTDVSASEIATGGGYTTGGVALTNVAVGVAAGVVTITADNVTWTGTSGGMAKTGSAIIYNDSHATKTIVMCIDFGADYTTAENQQFQLNFASGFATSSGS